MDDVIVRIVAAVVSALVFCIMTWKLAGAMQQSGYKNGVFLRWLKRKDNLYFNRLWVLALCLALAPTVTSLCFAFLGRRVALSVSAIVFFGLLLVFYRADRKYALKVPTARTGRLSRLFAVYLLFVACVAYFLIAFLWMLARWNGSELYALIAYVPFAVMPTLLPVLLCAANVTTGVFENAKNRKFVKRAGQVLDETQILRVGVVGSYGKTSVKNILKTLLSEKYSVVETPASYNTPIGVAKTVFSSEFENKQVFIVEMGARKAGDIAELCDLVKPDYAVFTGVCEQHIATFGNLENVWTEKSEIVKRTAKSVVCGASLREYLQKDMPTAVGNKALIADGDMARDVCLEATKTAFTLCVGGEEVAVETALLGSVAVENIVLAAALASEMGLTAAEIGRGISKLQPIPHRLQLLKNGGVYILDDGYNGNPRGAEEAILALGRFDGRKCVVTPGLVECGVLEEQINDRLGEQLAKAGFDKVILVGDTLVGAVKSGFERNGGDMQTLTTAKTLQAVQELLTEWLTEGDAVLFLNDLPDVY